MKTVWREPLLHFLIFGTGLFFVDSHLNREEGDARPTIVVDRDSLLMLLRSRSRASDPDRFRDVVDRMAPEDLQRIIQQYVREEALFREAKALQLDKYDYVSRLRLIQQLEFITRSLVDTQVQVTEEDILRHYEAHRSEYRVSPKVTFTHVFFSSERHGARKAEALARAELERLNGTHVRFDQAPSRGERFLYHVNYVDREPQEIASHFGPKMQAKVFALAPDQKRWQGPFQSLHGAHLVLLTHHEADYLPSLEEVRARVEEEARQAALDVRFEEAIQSILNAYDVKVKRDEFAALIRSQNAAEAP